MGRSRTVCVQSYLHTHFFYRGGGIEGNVRRSDIFAGAVIEFCSACFGVEEAEVVWSVETDYWHGH
jgi:hypothetical protein